MTELQQRSIGIIGAGRLGGSLALALGPAVRWLIRRHSGAAEVSGPAYTAKVLTDIAAIDTLPGCIALCVADGNIRPVADELAVRFGPELAGMYIVHCSGALGLTELAACKAQGARTLCAHPYQTFPRPCAESFRGIAWGIECEEADRDFIVNLVEQLGGIPVVLAAESRQRKALYHASAAVAANYATMLVNLAADIARAADVDPKVFLPAIMRSALEHALATLEQAGEPALTGPIARADVATLREHLQLLREAPEVLMMYNHLAEATAIMAQRQGLLSPEQRQAVLDVLGNVQL